MTYTDEQVIIGQTLILSIFLLYDFVTYQRLDFYFYWM